MHYINMTSKSDCIGVTCTRLRHFADTFSQWNSCWKQITLGHMIENKCGYQMHIFVTLFSTQYAPVWRCFCMVQPLRQPFCSKCTNRILQMHQQNPVVPPESGVHPQNPVCTYSVCISNSMPFLPSDLSANVQKPENVVNRPIDGQTDGQTDGQKSGRGALLLGGIAMAPSTWFRRKMW